MGKKEKERTLVEWLPILVKWEQEWRRLEREAKEKVGKRHE